jgi:hypothetical protein
MNHGAAKKRKSFTAEDAKVAEEEKNFTAKDAEAAKKLFPEIKVAKDAPRAAYRRRLRNCHLH